MSTQPWVEKYRPQVLKDVVGNEETVAKLQAVVNGGNMPNIILSGPPRVPSRVVARLLNEAVSEGRGWIQFAFGRWA